MGTRLAVLSGEKVLESSLAEEVVHLCAVVAARPPPRALEHLKDKKHVKISLEDLFSERV